MELIGVAGTSGLRRQDVVQLAHVAQLVVIGEVKSRHVVITLYQGALYLTCSDVLTCSPEM